MKKTLILTLFIMLFVSASLLAQTISRDSMINKATADGRTLRLTPTERQRFKAEGKDPGSDLFKPNTAIVSDASLLKDSVYVKAFRMAAYKRNKHTTWHYVLWGTVAVYAVACIIDIIASSSTSNLPAPGSLNIH
jgi:hypothetical protein